MKKANFFFTSIFALILFSCNAQKSEDKIVSSINFLEYINKEHVRTTTSIVNIEGRKYKIVLPFYEFLNVNTIKIGEACLFAMSKDYPEKWIEESIKNPKNECKGGSNYNDRYYINCESKRLFSEDTSLLIRNFYLLSFFIDRKDIEGPFYEHAEGGKLEYYEFKDDCTYIVYKFLNGEWIEIDRIKLKEKLSLRNFGQSYMKELGAEKIRKYAIH
ncbi:MAG: hypothetical protein K8R31_12315 [Bacteroidales bacterium]|nr:hypothetical protein [Bacteroidales bacterium]